MNKALLVGINAYADAPLRGCVNDVVDMADFLVAHCGFARADIRLLTDGRATASGIRERLTWLLSGLRRGDKVVFHFSGHGTQLTSRNASGEVDGLDEVICPADYDWNRLDETFISDKEFQSVFHHVPVGVKFVWISDSCHSGDLTRNFVNPLLRMASTPPDRLTKFLPPPADLQWRLSTANDAGLRPLTIERAASRRKRVVLVPGCKSDQTSADAFFDGRANGALTYYLLKELRSEGGLARPLKTVVDNVRAKLVTDRFTQEPFIEGNLTLQRKAFLA